MLDRAEHIHITNVIFLLSYRQFKFQNKIFVVLSIIIGHTALSFLRFQTHTL